MGFVATDRDEVMPIPLLVPVLGALVAAAAAEEESSGEKPEWQILIDDDEWKGGKGHVRVNFEERIILGEAGSAPSDLEPQWMLFAQIHAPFDGSEVGDWFYCREDEMEEARRAFLEGRRQEASDLTANLDQWLRREASLLPGEWTFSISDDVFDDVSASGIHGFIDVDYKNREVNAYSLVSGISPAELGKHDVRFARDICQPISGEEVREWFEDRELELEDARRKQLVLGVSSFQDGLEIHDFKWIFFSPKGWLNHISKNSSTHGVLRDLLSLDLKDVIESDLSWTITRFGPEDLVGSAVEFISEELQYDLRKLVDRIDFVEGDEVLKILDEPYLFLQIRPSEPDEDDKNEEEEYESEVRQIAEEMERYTKKEFISIQRDEDDRQLPYVQISLPWNP